MSTKWVYQFNEGNAEMRNLLGGKGANLAEMTGLGLPIPQGFTVTTEACTNYYDCGENISDEVQGQILNLGLNGVAVEGFAKKTGNPRFAYDSYRRFIQMFADVVKEVDKAKFEAVLDEMKEAKGAKFDTDLTADDLKEVIVRYKEIYKSVRGRFPAGAERTVVGSDQGCVPFVG